MLKTLLTIETTVGRRKRPAPVRVDLMVATPADDFTLATKGSLGGGDTGLPLLVSTQVGQFVVEAAEPHGAFAPIPSHFDKPSFTVWPPM